MDDWTVGAVTEQDMCLVCTEGRICVSGSLLISQL